jgi:hypothetical protein
MAFQKRENAVDISASLNLSLEEIAFLLGAKPGSKKAEKVFGESQELRQKETVQKRKGFAAMPFAGREEPEEADAKAVEPGLEEGRGQTRLF